MSQKGDVTKQITGTLIQAVCTILVAIGAVVSLSSSLYSALVAPEFETMGMFAGDYGLLGTIILILAGIGAVVGLLIGRKLINFFGLESTTKSQSLPNGFGIVITLLLIVLGFWLWNYIGNQ